MSCARCLWVSILCQICMNPLLIYMSFCYAADANNSTKVNFLHMAGTVHMTALMHRFLYGEGSHAINADLFYQAFAYNNNVLFFYSVTS